MERDINFDYLQAFEGVCRQELKFKSAVAGAELQKALITSKLANAHFDQVFERIQSDVQFNLNPNMRKFRRILKTEGNDSDQKPVIFVYSPQLYMSRYVHEFTAVLKQYQEVFDVYYCNDEQTAKEYFYLHEFPDVIPFVTIIDPKRRVALRSPRNKSELIPVKSTRPLEEGSYIYKTRKLIMFNKIQEDLQKLIDEFLDDDLQMFYQTEKLRQATRVKEVCA